jgi:hypothetical protein
VFLDRQVEEEISLAADQSCVVASLFSRLLNYEGDGCHPRFDISLDLYDSSIFGGVEELALGFKWTT